MTPSDVAGQEQRSSDPQAGASRLRGEPVQLFNP